ncbi:LytTR family transcriptional regulator [Paenibacillus oenotherae]|uniref:LytTR family transcriptional regulator n=1 Tax=Paenibacillus oenotherae TaxID=1435645 RepID=A0ABS7D6E0_9BACL|nr:LytTR family DNA-binding domain-containing protein [Paenibacillus oenotherae]MBW7475502.1 LytTR family transcriptional regulator [Paenibacillus oenotherae]
MRLAKYENNILLHDSVKIVFIDINDILFLEKLGNDTYIHTVDKTVKASVSLKNIHTLLSPDFFRSHRSFIINKRQIVEIQVMNATCYEVVFMKQKKALIKKEKINEIIT